jgi:hypothetical protein
MALLLAAVVGCGLSPRADFDDVRVGQRVEERNVQQEPVVLAAPGRLAESAVLHEGLAHQKSEEWLLKQERSRAETTDLDGLAFYRETLPPQRRRPPQDPGHPRRSADVRLVEWRKGLLRLPSRLLPRVVRGRADVADVSLFGCGEARLVGPERNGHYSLAREARKKLAQVLFPYRKNRPDSPGWKELLRKHQ